MATKATPPSDPASVQDAVDLLIADHKRVAKLFAAFDSLKEQGSDAEKSSLVSQICQELIIHTTLEEEVFYPAVRKAIEDGDLMDEALVEHEGAKQLIAQLQAATPDEELYDARVTVLGEQIDHHVTEEEGSMFPQTRASDLDTVALGTQMLARRAELLANLPGARLAFAPAPPSPHADEDDAQDREWSARGSSRKLPVPTAKRAAAPAKQTAAKNKTAKKKTSGKKR